MRPSLPWEAETFIIGKPMALDHQKINQLLQRLRSKPYRVYPVRTPHTGYLREILVEEGAEVKGPGGRWKEIPGTPLFTLERERNLKTLRARIGGTVHKVRKDLEGQFVEAEETVLEIHHPLAPEEVIAEFLKETLTLVTAPETARYILSPEIEKRLRKDGPGKALVKPQEELVIMSFMKRETPLPHSGEPMVIFQVFFKPQEVVPAGEPLLGLALPEEVPYLQKVIARIREEWPEP